MNDLELCKRIAEIEGLEFKVKRDAVLLLPWPQYRDKYQYNPLTDKALLWDLMVKYRVDIDWRNREIYSLNVKGDQIFISSHYEDESGILRAVLLAIIEAHADDK